MYFYVFKIYDSENENMEKFYSEDEIKFDVERLICSFILIFVELIDDIGLLSVDEYC